jgi:LysR family transcriptional regulator, nitrogen assimilation regulatory protein
VTELAHLAPVQLRSLPPLKLVVPGQQNARRSMIEAYLASNSVPIERIVELDAMLGTLDFVANSDWVTILPGIMMVSDVEQPLLTINPIVEPAMTVDLMLVEPLRRVLSPAAEAFVQMLRDETGRLNEVWPPYLIA